MSNFEVMQEPERAPGLTYTWAGERLGYLRGSVAAVVLGHRNASKDMMLQIQDKIGWKVTDQVRDFQLHGKRLWDVMDRVYKIEYGPRIEGSYQCEVCGVWNIGGEGDPDCWNCEAD